MDGHMTGLLDLFSLAETTLLADVIQYLRDTPRVQFSFAAVREDVRAAVNGERSEMLQFHLIRDGRFA